MTILTFQVLGTYTQDFDNSGEFPAFIKGDKHLYFLKVQPASLSHNQTTTPVCNLTLTSSYPQAPTRKFIFHILTPPQVNFFCVF